LPAVGFGSVYDDDNYYGYVLNNQANKYMSEEVYIIITTIKGTLVEKIN
jgi:hypothetical protein